MKLFNSRCRERTSVITQVCFRCPLSFQSDFNKRESLKMTFPSRYRVCIVCVYLLLLCSVLGMESGNEVTQLMCTDFGSQDLERGVEALLTQRLQCLVLCSDITALSDRLW